VNTRLPVVKILVREPTVKRPAMAGIGRRLPESAGGGRNRPVVAGISGGPESDGEKEEEGQGSRPERWRRAKAVAVVPLRSTSSPASRRRSPIASHRCSPFLSHLGFGARLWGGECRRRRQHRFASRRWGKGDEEVIGDREREGNTHRCRRLRLAAACRSLLREGFCLRRNEAVSSGRFPCVSEVGSSETCDTARSGCGIGLSFHLTILRPPQTTELVNWTPIPIPCLVSMQPNTS
jgi:hypothetical protein